LTHLQGIEVTGLKVDVKKMMGQKEGAVDGLTKGEEGYRSRGVKEG